MCQHECHHECSAGCNHKIDLSIVNRGTVCGVYYDSERPDGLDWGHFPKCECGNCPKNHPELLDVLMYNGKIVRAKLDDVIVEC